MSKTCSVCSLPEEARQKIDDLLRQGVSRKKIAESVGKDFLTPMTQSSLNRHLKNCTGKQKAMSENLPHFPLLKEKARWCPLQGADVYKAICNLFSEEIERFIERLSDEKSLGHRLDDLKCLDLLINMMVKLYPDVKQGVVFDALDDFLYVDRADFSALINLKIKAAEDELEKMPTEEREKLEKLESEDGVTLAQNKTILLNEVVEWLGGKNGYFNEKGFKIKRTMI